MMLDQVRNLSHQMRLFGIHEACEREAQIALSQQLHPWSFYDCCSKMNCCRAKTRPPRRW